MPNMLNTPTCKTWKMQTFQSNMFSLLLSCFLSFHTFNMVNIILHVRTSFGKKIMCVHLCHFQGCCMFFHFETFCHFGQLIHFDIFNKIFKNCCMFKSVSYLSKCFWIHMFRHLKHFQKIFISTFCNTFPNMLQNVQFLQTSR